MKLLLGLTFFVGTLLALAEPEGKGEQGLEGFVWQDSEGKPVSDTASMKSKDGFGGQFALTANERFYEEWARPEMPMIKKVSKLPIGKFLVPVVIFANPEKDKGGNVDVAYDLEIIKPDGSIGRTVSDVVCAKGPNKVPTFVLQLSQSERMWGAEVGDPLGVYTFKLILKDNIRGTKLPLEASVEIVEEEPYYWFSSYYRNPSPERFITEVRSLIQNDILSNEDSQLSFIAFLSQVMAANPKEITKWLEEFHILKKKLRRFWKWRLITMPL